MPSVTCTAPCAFRSYNKYRQKKDGTYELNKSFGAGGPQGTCQHGTMIKVGFKDENNFLTYLTCLSFEHWDTLLTKPTDAEHRRAK
jgi:hypothetical protein